MPDASLSAADVQDVAATDGRVPEPHKREPYSGDSNILTPTSSHCASHASQMWLPARVDARTDRKSTRLNSSHSGESRMPSSA